MSRENKAGLTIGRAASAVGVAATTLRFYEREGILAPAVRTASGHRLYDEQALERLRFIREAQGIGFTLEDIRSLLQADGEVPCSRVQSIIQRRLTEVDEKLSALRRVRAKLAKAMERCRASEAECAVVADLKRKHRSRRST